MPAAELFKTELFGGDQIVINGLAAVDERDLTLRADLTEQGSRLLGLTGGQIGARIDRDELVTLLMDLFGHAAEHRKKDKWDGVSVIFGGIWNTGERCRSDYRK